MFVIESLESERANKLCYVIIVGREEDGLKVVRVENVYNPYKANNSNDRFKLTMNKLYAWNLVNYERVIMLDADNLFLQNTDELFQ